MKTVAEKIQKGYSKKYKKSDSDEQSDPDAREEMARSAFVSTCKASGEQRTIHSAAESRHFCGCCAGLLLLLLCCC